MIDPYRAATKECANPITLRPFIMTQGVYQFVKARVWLAGSFILHRTTRSETYGLGCSTSGAGDWESVIMQVRTRLMKRNRGNFQNCQSPKYSSVDLSFSGEQKPLYGLIGDRCLDFSALPIHVIMAFPLNHEAGALCQWQHDASGTPIFSHPFSQRSDTTRRSTHQDNFEFGLGPDKSSFFKNDLTRLRWPSCRLSSGTKASSRGLTF